SRRDGSGHFNIEFDLAVGSAAIPCRTVRGSIDRDRGHLGRRVDSELLEITVDIALVVAAAELNDSVGLALAGKSSGKVEKVSQLQRRIGLRLNGACRRRLLGQEPA